MQIKVRGKISESGEKRKEEEEELAKIVEAEEGGDGMRQRHETNE